MLRHCLQSFVNLIIGPAGVGLFSKDFSDRQLSGKTVSRSHGDANIPVGNDGVDRPIGSDNRQHSTVVLPHQLNGSPNVSIGNAADCRMGHNILNFHTGFPPLEGRASSASASACPYLGGVAFHQL
jgi:hypothetical protein